MYSSINTELRPFVRDRHSGTGGVTGQHSGKHRLTQHTDRTEATWRVN